VFIVALVATVLAALLHVYIWSMESLTWRKPATWKRFGVSSQEDAETQALFAFNQGFYNLFLGIMAAIGVVAIHRPGAGGYIGWTLILAATGCMLGAAVVLRSCGREYTRPAILQGVFPLVAIVASVVFLTS
jgi:putative membrane protein